MAEDEEKAASRQEDVNSQALSSSSSASPPLTRTHSKPEQVLRRIRSTPTEEFHHPRGGDKTGDDVLVDFEGPDDPYHPLNWPRKKKLGSLLLFGVTAIGASFNSAVFSAADREVAKEYNVSNIVTSLGTTMILLGFATGPLLWGPLSEIYGRKYVVLIPYAICSIFVFGCGAATNLATILIMRYFQGVFSGAIITNTGGAVSDIFSPKERGNALIVYSLSVIGAPLLAPLIGSAIVYSYLGWRWTMYIVGIYQISTAVLAMALLDESYAPVLLLRKARQLRYTTGNWALHAKHEEWNVSFKQMATKYLARPFQLLFDPICFLMSLYASFVYGLIYGSLSAIPVVFEEHRGYSPVVGALPFIALLLGCIIGLIGNTFNQAVYKRAMLGNDGKPVPEARLYPMMAGGFALAAGLFIFGWTGDTDIIWVVPCIGIVLVGIGFYPIFQSSLNYVIDTYLPVAASAIATVTFMRSLTAAAFPLFIRPMLDGLGVAWGLSLLGFVGVALLPSPFLFYVFGKRIRAKSKFALS